MKIVWKNYRHHMKGQYHRYKDGTIDTLKLEACCDPGLYVWNWVSDRFGTNNENDGCDVPAIK